MYIFLVPLLNINMQIYKHCRGEDDSLNDFMAATERKSVSCDINYGIRFTKKEEAVTFLGRVVEEVCKRLNQSRRIAGSVTLKLLLFSNSLEKYRRFR